MKGCLRSELRVQNLFDPLADEVNLYLPNAGMELKSVDILKGRGIAGTLHDYGPQLWLILSTLAMLMSLASTATDPLQTAVLKALKRNLQDPSKNLHNWMGEDPCGEHWKGVVCDNLTSHVIELRLLNLKLGGHLIPELGELPYLQNLNVMWNSLTGSIPPSLGNLTNLKFLLLSGNRFSGHIPEELGRLENLTRMQLDENQFTGPVPLSFGNLLAMEHLYLNNNSLNGSLPGSLAQLPKLLHLMVDNNQLSGDLPNSLGYAPALQILQLDNNRFIGSNIAVLPASYTNLQGLIKLSLRNCSLQGGILDLSGLSRLNVLDLSYNSLTGNIPQSNFSANLTTIELSHNNLTGSIPQDVFMLPNLQALVLKGNQLNGTIPSLNYHYSSYNSVLIDLQDNLLTGVDSSVNVSANHWNDITLLGGNAKLCNILAHSNLHSKCAPLSSTFFHQLPQAFFTGNGTLCTSCKSPNVLVPWATTNNCECADPITIDLRLKSPSFYTFTNPNNLLSLVASQLNLSRKQVFLQAYEWQPGPRLRTKILIFPLNSSRFSPYMYNDIFSFFVNWGFTTGLYYGPYEILYFGSGWATSNSRKLTESEMVGIILGFLAIVAFSVAASVLLIILSRRRKLNHPPSKSFIRIMRKHGTVKLEGVKCFSIEELMEATNQFRERKLGTEVHIKVYKATLRGGQRVVVKRAQRGYLQGDEEFCKEIEFLSQIRHRHVESLLGFCVDKGEQMLIYNYSSGGSLQDRIVRGKGLPLDFRTRLKIAMGSAKGILYLTKELQPPIIHCDIKLSNILLEKDDIPKVANYGKARLDPMPKLMVDANANHISTTIRGTKGYVDQQQFLPQQIVDKGDHLNVRSFGIVLLELFTGMPAVTNQKHILQEVDLANRSGNLTSLGDPSMGPSPGEVLESLLLLGIVCCNENCETRPSMIDVVGELEELWLRVPGSELATH